MTILTFVMTVLSIAGLTSLMALAGEASPLGQALAFLGATTVTTGIPILATKIYNLWQEVMEAANGIVDQ